MRPHLLLENIRRNVAPRKIIRFSLSADGKLYEGQVSQRAFKINRIVVGRNSFIPVIQGRLIDSKDDVTKIALLFRLHWWVAVFFCTVSAMLLASKLSVVGSLVFIAISYLVSMILFNLEVRKDEILLTNILGLQEVKPEADQHT